MILALAIVAALEAVVLWLLCWDAERTIRGLIKENEQLEEELRLNDRVAMERANMMHKRLAKQAERN